MKLQLALDRLAWEECFQIVTQCKDFVDWIEIGTGVIKEYGMEIVREMRNQYPDKTIVADMKTCDAGRHEAIQAFEAGADITTVMAFSADLTISDTLKVARQYKRRVMVDLLEVSGKNRINELESLGVDLVSLHVGKDRQKAEGFDPKLYSFVADSGFEVSVAGGIDEENLEPIIKERPNTIIVGSAITKALEPKKVALKIKNRLVDHSIKKEG